MCVIPDTFGVWNIKAKIGSLVLLKRLSQNCVTLGYPRHGVAAWGVARLLGVVRLLGDLETS